MTTALAGRVRLGSSDLAVSRVGFGSTGIGLPAVRADRAAVDRMVGAYLDAGGNLFDTADSYNGGWSEAVLGRVLRGRRDQVVVATKVGMPVGPAPGDAGLGRRHVLASAERSLRRLGSDRIDLFQVHLFDDATPLGETLRALDDLVRAGTVRALGASSFHPWQLASATRLQEREGLARFDTMQCKYSLLRRDAEAELLAYCRAVGVSVLAYSPLQGGVLAGCLARGVDPPPGSRFASPFLRRVFLGDDEGHAHDVAEAVADIAAGLGRAPGEVALAWVLRRPDVASVLVGPERLAEVTEAVGALDLALDAEATDRLDAVAPAPVLYPADLYAGRDAMFADMRDRAAAAGPPPDRPQEER